MCKCIFKKWRWSSCYCQVLMLFRFLLSLALLVAELVGTVEPVAAEEGVHINTALAIFLGQHKKKNILLSPHLPELPARRWERCRWQPPWSRGRSPGSWGCWPRHQCRSRWRSRWTRRWCWWRSRWGPWWSPLKRIIYSKKCIPYDSTDMRWLEWPCLHRRRWCAQTPSCGRSGCSPEPAIVLV